MYLIKKSINSVICSIFLIVAGLLILPNIYLHGNVLFWILRIILSCSFITTGFGGLRNVLFFPDGKYSRYIIQSTLNSNSSLKFSEDYKKRGFEERGVLGYKFLFSPQVSYYAVYSVIEVNAVSSQKYKVISINLRILSRVYKTICAQRHLMKKRGYLPLSEIVNGKPKYVVSLLRDAFEEDTLDVRRVLFEDDVMTSQCLNKRVTCFGSEIINTSTSLFTANPVINSNGVFIPDSPEICQGVDLIMKVKSADNQILPSYIMSRRIPLEWWFQPRCYMQDIIRHSVEKYCKFISNVEKISCLGYARSVSGNGKPLIALEVILQKDLEDILASTASLLKKHKIDKNYVPTEDESDAMFHLLV